MGATYNWAYKPGVTNKYGITVPAGADTARPSGWAYVALFGNDTSGNGSRNYPYRTIAKAIAVVGTSVTIVLGSGVYRESGLSSSTNLSMYGDGDVTIDLTLTTQFMTNGCNLYNIKFIGQNTPVFGGGNTWIIKDCIFNSVYIWPIGAANFFNGTMQGCTLINSFFSAYSSDLTNNVGNFSRNTFYRSNVYWINQNGKPQIYGFTNNNIFQECNVWWDQLPATIDFCLFWHCNFRFNASTPTFPTSFYPAVPTGFSYYNTLSAAQTAINTAFGSSNVLNKCGFADPLFNNAAINDFSLSFSSPAKNLSYLGTYVGAQSIAYQIKASATESAGAFDFSTNVNLTVADDSITLVNPAVNAEIKTKMIINAAGRQIQRFPIYGFNADRNGQYIDSIPDLDTSVKNAGDTLTVPASYIVETGAVTYNSAIYQVGDRLTTVTGQTTFTTAVSGVLREIIEAPERHTIMARFSDGGASVSAGDALVSGYWYYVVTGSITYDSVVYNAGSGFKAVDTNAFSGSGSVIVALSTETFQHYEPGIQPTSNNTGDARTGSIIRGNGDPAYVRGGYGVQEFPINAKFIQLYYIINVSNLKP